MVNSAQIKEVVDAFKLDLRVQNIPSTSAVVESNPKLLKEIDLVIVGTANNATSATILTTPTDTRTFYLTAVHMSITKNAAATSTASTITAVIQGVTSTIYRINYTASTAQTTINNSLSFPVRIKIDKGTAINVTNTNAAADITASAIIYGYYLED